MVSPIYTTVGPATQKLKGFEDLSKRFDGSEPRSDGRGAGWQAVAMKYRFYTNDSTFFNITAGASCYCEVDAFSKLVILFRVASQSVMKIREKCICRKKIARI